jgi:uncharacterized SAM-binding protein YcdF (DUF218 family)
MRSRWKGWFVRGVGVGLAIALLFVGFVSARMAIAFYQAPQPQAIFVLGGDFARTTYAAQVWQVHQDMDVWVSDFSVTLEEHRKRLTQLGVPEQQMRLDGRATDTVTNFTALVDQFKEQGLQHLYLVTSDFHMQRARAIAAIVLGSGGIVVTPMAVPSQVESESWVKVLRDMGRSLLWLVTRRTGASLNPALEQ